MCGVRCCWWRVRSECAHAGVSLVSLTAMACEWIGCVSSVSRSLACWGRAFLRRRKLGALWATTSVPATSPHLRRCPLNLARTPHHTIPLPQALTACLRFPSSDSQNTMALENERSMPEFAKRKHGRLATRAYLHADVKIPSVRGTATQTPAFIVRGYVYANALTSRACFGRGDVSGDKSFALDPLVLSSYAALAVHQRLQLA